MPFDPGRFLPLRRVPPLLVGKGLGAICVGLVLVAWTASTLGAAGRGDSINPCC